MKFSYSTLQLFRRCPRQYEFAQIKKIGRTITAPESFGSSVHNALKAWGDQEVDSRELIVESDQLAMFVEPEKAEEQRELTRELLLEFWHQKFIVEGYKSRQEADAARKKGEMLMGHFFTWWQQKERSIAAIETGFSLPIENYTISGRFDRIEEDENGLHVIDFKTSKPRPQTDVDEDLQLSIYALAAQEEFGKPVQKLTLLFLGEDAIHEVHTQRSVVQLQEAKQQILAYCKGVESGNFAPTPSQAVCKRCPYRSICDAAVV